MAVVQELANELLGYVPGLSILLAEKMVQDTWRKIRDSRQWSFLRVEGSLDVPDLISTGTVTATQFSTSVVGDAAAGAAWAAVTLPLLTLRQFRLAAGSPIYNITAFDGAVTLTLDRMYTGATVAASAYQIYQCYYKVPVKDFLRWRSLFNPSLGYRFRRRNMHRKKEEIDRRDPQRSHFGTPIWAAAYKHSSDGYPLIELWPHPTSSGNSLMCVAQRRGVDLGTAEEVPECIPHDLLAHGSRLQAYEWALANNKNANKGPEWSRLLSVISQDYDEMLRRARVQDEETYPQNFSELEYDSGLSGPIDASYLQDHDMYFVG
jgi:hypothetical protein